VLKIINEFVNSWSCHINRSGPVFWDTAYIINQAKS